MTNTTSHTPTIHPTPFVELGYIHNGRADWRFVTTDDGSAVGRSYRTRAELLADVLNYASFYGCDGAAPWTPDAEPETVEPSPTDTPEQVEMPPAEIGTRHLYAPMLRPPFGFNLPKGTFQLVERPAHGYDFARRTDLPLSVHPHGVVEYERELTRDEIESFSLLPIDPASEEEVAA